ncbi:MAG: methionyl-tRNA formyltransferase [Alphaproteobacteria bacterium]|nr:methionyl-tRNA formyltransferase [Alphaproteobacteria bacterium]
MKIILAGQRSFGAAVLAMLIEERHEVLQVFAPISDRLADAAWAAGIEHKDAISAATVADGADLIVCAHAHVFVSERARERTRLGGIGYHPSLLPRHRGRDAVRWTVHMKDEVAGGTVYWLTNRIDAGPMAAQDWCWVKPGDDASSLWQRELFPMGVRLLRETLRDLAAGRIVKAPQDEAAATWEPSWERPPLGRPDLPRLPAPGDVSTAYETSLKRR